MKTIRIAGKEYTLTAFEEVKKRMVWVEARTSFNFYSLEYKGMLVVVLEPKDTIHFSPRQLRLIAQRMTEIYKLPIVFLLDNIRYTDRNRLIEQDVYFVVSGKYVFLPNLLIMTRDIEPRHATVLNPVAQWVLLAYLQGKIPNNQTADELTQTTPFQYVTLTRAFRVLESLNLCHIESDEARYKHVVFEEDRHSLFNAAKPYMISPVRERVYCDDVANDTQYRRAGISALAHYTALNPEEMQTIAIPVTQWRKRQDKDFVGINPYEGNYCVEIWKHEPIPTNSQYVDKLSLALSLQDDHDPRVEKEVKQMIEQIW